MYARAGNVKHSFSTIRALFAAVYYKEQVFDLWNLFKGEHTYKLMFIHCCPFIHLPYVPPPGPQICLFKSDSRKITDTLILCNSLLRALVGGSAYLKLSWKCGWPVKLDSLWMVSNVCSPISPSILRLTKYWIEVHRRLRSGLPP